MRRVQFIELHEQPWFPSSLRADVTDALQFGFNLLHAYAPIAPLLQSVIDSTGNETNIATIDRRYVFWRRRSVVGSFSKAAMPERRRKFRGPSDLAHG